MAGGGRSNGATHSPYVRRLHLDRLIRVPHLFSMRLLTDLDLRLQFGTALRPYTPHALKMLNRDRLCDILIEAMAPYTILQFSVRGSAPEAYGVTDPGRAAATKREEVRSADLERALRAAVLAILAVAEVRQR